MLPQIASVIRDTIINSLQSVSRVYNNDKYDQNYSITSSFKKYTDIPLNQICLYLCTWNVRYSTCSAQAWVRRVSTTQTRRVAGTPRVRWRHQEYLGQARQWNEDDVPSGIGSPKTRRWTWIEGFLFIRFDYYGSNYYRLDWLKEGTWKQKKRQYRFWTQKEHFKYPVTLFQIKHHFRYLKSVCPILSLITIM